MLSFTVMIRKSLFWGLTLVLIVALVNLIIRGRRLEKQQSEATVQQSKPSATRVLSPQDLEIVNSALPLNPGHPVLRDLEIRNSGTVAYGSIQLRIACLDRSGKVLATKNHLISKLAMPGTTLKLSNLTIEGIPAETVILKLSISCADIESQQSSA
jgi:hypothetical protein